MIANYERKMWFMVRRQKSVCCCCGRLMRVTVLDGVYFDQLKQEKVDFCHNLSRTADNQRLFPLFIDSTYNCGAGHNSCNVSRYRLRYMTGQISEDKFFTAEQAAEWEARLANNPEMQKIANGDI